MKRTRATKPPWQLKIAAERVEKLLGLSGRELDARPEKSRRYVRLARTIGLRYNLRLGKAQKEKFCKSCNTFMVLGKTMTVRIVEGKVSKRCSVCGSKVT
ncbi:hypothetical protein A3K63_03385 [Candidatus Micrarchaeota archaeon RBG_16_49_10]|nr:MAG: hypothetical protein A3K63_03385 [Candidatus Micrarchaeota archaeon RBG_16_49_10]